MINKAIQFAVKAHEGQVRKGTAIPYIMHPIEAATIVASMKFEEELISAALLHDIVEETEYYIEDVENLFGERVAFLVATETEDKSKTWEERKEHTLRHLAEETDEDVLIVTLGDKLSNIRAIYNDYSEIGDELWSRFNRGKESQSWYYKGLVESLSNICRLEEYQEFKDKVEKTFKT